MDKVFDKMKQTRKLTLPKTQMLLHFFPVFVFLLIASICFFISLVAHEHHLSLDFKFLSLTAILIAIYLFYRQFNQLNFTSIQATLTEQEFRDMFEILAKKMNWLAEYSGESYVVATIEFKWSNWGTLITLIRDKDCILVNSICDLHNKPTTTSWGQNKRNVEAVKNYLSAFSNA